MRFARSCVHLCKSWIFACSSSATLNVPVMARGTKKVLQRLWHNFEAVQALHSCRIWLLGLNVTGKQTIRLNAIQQLYVCLKTDIVAILLLRQGCCITM